MIITFAMSDKILEISVIYLHSRTYYWINLLAQNPIISLQMYLNATCDYYNSQKEKLDNA